MPEHIVREIERAKPYICKSNTSTLDHSGRDKIGYIPLYI